MFNKKGVWYNTYNITNGSSMSEVNELTPTIIKEDLSDESFDRLSKFEKDLIGKSSLNYRGITVNKEKEPIEFISTGVMTLDYCFGGGIPVGKIIEIFGQNSVGKSVIASKLMSAIQKSGRLPALIDAERRFDPQFAEVCGLDLSKLAVQKPSSLEEALDYMRKTIDSGLFGMVVIDSVASLAPIEELEKDMTEQTIGKIAKAYARVLREVAATADDNKCTILLLNQMRANITSYGASTTTTGGNAIPYYCSLRGEVKRDKKQDKDTSITSIISIKKSSVGMPFREGEITISFPHTNKHGEIKAGIDEVADVVNLAITLNVITKSGAWFYVNKGQENEIRAQGKEKMIATLEENKEMLDNVTRLIKGII